MTELEKIREEIDTIDEKIMQLYNQRMQAAKKVAQIKNRSMDSIYKKERELEILEKVKSMALEHKQGAKNLFETLMRQSRQLQYRYRVDTKDNLPVDSFISSVSHIDVQRVCYAGPLGSYTSLASRKMYDSAEQICMPTFFGVCKQVVSGTADVGILPIENTTEGIVNEVYDLIVSNNLYIINQCELEISHVLAAQNGASVENIKTVYSHKQALAQCKKYILDNGIQPVEYETTAAAAKLISENGDKTIAAICSKEAANKYGLQIIDENINTIKENKTRFIAVASNAVYNKDNNKVLIAFTLAHESGSLAKIINNFGDLEINMAGLMSRPLVGCEWEYRFYVEFFGNINDYNVKALLYQLMCEAGSVQFLGSYK